MNLETERGNSRSYSVQNSFWERLWSFAFLLPQQSATVDCSKWQWASVL